MSYNPARAPVYKGKIAVEEAITLPELTGKIAGAPSYSVGGLGEKCELRHKALIKSTALQIAISDLVMSFTPV